MQTFAAVAAARIVIITPEPTSLTDSYALIKVLNNRFGMRDFMILVNQVASAKEAQASFEKLDGACRHFLHLEPVLLGHVRTDNKLPQAVCRQQPLMRFAPGCPAAQDLQSLAARLQRVRLSMADWLATRKILQAMPAVVCAANSIPVQPGEGLCFSKREGRQRARPHCRRFALLEHCRNSNTKKRTVSYLPTEQKV